MESRLEKSILAGIVYFDLFDYPLTLVEIYRFILDFAGASKKMGQADLNGQKTGQACLTPTLGEIKSALENSAILQKNIICKDGLYCLRKNKIMGSGQACLSTTRHKRYIIAKKKFTTAFYVAKFFKSVPFVRAIFISNSLSYNNAKEGSDIDFVIIAKKGGVWWARAICLIMLWLLKMRPGQESKRDKVCLSVFADENHFDFGKYKISEMDIDYMYWVANFYPIYDAGGYWDKFWSVNEGWIRENIPTAQKAIPHTLMKLKGMSVVGFVFEILLRPFSKIAEIIQRLKFPEPIRSLVNQDTRVRVEDGFLKFHVNDRREENLEKFVKRYEEVINL